MVNSEDSSEERAGILWSNTFSYCLNNPINMIDVNGDTPVYIDPIQQIDYYIKLLQRLVLGLVSSYGLVLADLSITRQLFEFALFGNGGQISDDTKNSIRDALIGSKIFKSKVKEALEKHRNTYVWLTGGTAVLNDSLDLLLGIHGVHFIASGVKKDGVWRVSVKAWDVFDFTQIWNPFDGNTNPFAAIVNDVGTILQSTSRVFPFKWEVVFEMLIF